MSIRIVKPGLTQRRWLMYAVAVLTVCLTGTLLQYHWGLNLADESYLWYGSQQTAKGYWPLRDFMSYDPGRYWIGAAWFVISGDNGILSLRRLLGLLTGVTVLYASALTSRVWPRTRLWSMALTALTLYLWLIPPYKVFDILASVVMVGNLAWLLSGLQLYRFTVFGVVIGLLAVIGRNHGVYGIVACVLASPWLLQHAGKSESIRRVVAFFFGLVVGYLPIWIPMIKVPGFKWAMLQSIELMFSYGSTNIALPVPWPWKVNYGQPDWFPVLIEGLFFVGLLGFDVAVGLRLLGRRKRAFDVPALLIASWATAVPYTHYAFSRADLSHLCQGVFPALIGLGLSLPIRWRGGAVAVIIFLASLPVVICQQPRYQAHLAQRPWELLHLNGDALMVPSDIAQQVEFIRHEKMLAEGHAIYVAPYAVGAYSIIDQRSPAWEIYPLVQRPEAFQREEISRIQSSAPARMLINNDPLDGRDEMRFSNTHSLIMNYIRRCYVPANDPPVADYLVYVGPSRCSDLSVLSP